MHNSSLLSASPYPAPHWHELSAQPLEAAVARAFDSLSLKNLAPASSDNKARSDSCPYRQWRAARRSFGPHIPQGAGALCFPGDEGGCWCGLADAPCDPQPDYCPLWKPSRMICPLCLSFATRRWPLSRFNEVRLLIRQQTFGSAEPSALIAAAEIERCAINSNDTFMPGSLYCPDCNEYYRDLEELAQAALSRLRDLLDDLDYNEQQYKGSTD